MLPYKGFANKPTWLVYQYAAQEEFLPYWRDILGVVGTTGKLAWVLEGKISGKDCKFTRPIEDSRAARLLTNLISSVWDSIGWFEVAAHLSEKLNPTD